MFGFWDGLVILDEERVSVLKLAHVKYTYI